MKLLSVEIARSIWMFDLGLLNPKGISFQDSFEKLGARYQFSKFPRNLLDLNEQKALAFQVGTFVNSAKVPITVSFNVYNNGFVAETLSTTDDATEFLQDLTKWLAKEFDFAVPSGNNLHKGHLSQVGVELETSLSPLNPKIAAFVERLNAQFRSVDGKPKRFDIASVSFWTEEFGEPNAPSSFRLERKWGKQFTSNQYFSQAPLETRQHLDLLREFEKILTAQKE